MADVGCQALADCERAQCTANLLCHWQSQRSGFAHRRHRRRRGRYQLGGVWYPASAPTLEVESSTDLARLSASSASAVGSGSSLVGDVRACDDHPLGQHREEDGDPERTDGERLQAEPWGKVVAPSPWNPRGPSENLTPGMPSRGMAPAVVRGWRK